MTPRFTNGQAAPGSASPSPSPSPVRSAPTPASAVNDFALKIASVNGTGSASANGLLMQAIFRMGIPVSGKNIFPSNIQGLPTWYEIRVNSSGHVARTGRFQLLVAMNSQTYKKDVAELESGGYLVYDSSWPLDATLSREDVHFLGIPLAQMCNDKFQGPRERMLMKNIAYVGALAALLEVDLDIIDQLMKEQYGAKKALMQSNFAAVKLGYDYAREHFACPLPIRLERMAPPDDYILIDGNTAAALGCVYAGATVGAWYPITPSTSLMDAFRRFCSMYRRDQESGKNKFLVVQAEDELAAAGVVLGASWAGARAFTPTSGPGISLMNEFIGFAYYAEVPSVFIDVQRVGPSTGMPTRTQQGDLLLCAYASHGDTKHIALYPSDPADCFELAVVAFDLADRFQTPVFFVTDLDVGMNDWRVKKLQWDDGYRPDRGKVLNAEQLESMNTFYRYIDVDEDGVTARTLPGVHPKGAFFTRGSGHNRFGAYTEDSDEYADVMERVARKIENARTAVPPAIIHSTGADVGIVAIGSSDGAVREAVDQLAAEGMAVDYMRIRAFPFGPEVDDFLMQHEVNCVVDQNRDGQLLSLLTLETRAPKNKLMSVRYFGGLPLSAHHVVDGVRTAFQLSGSAPK
ncbi:MAG: 2-oxoacid:acceptor oxidoreductase subunit alpha [Longimicrobiales bacterium]